MYVYQYTKKRGKSSSINGYYIRTIYLLFIKRERIKESIIL